MMITDAGITVTGGARGIVPWIGGSEAEVLTGEGRTAATDPIMTGGGHRPATGAMSGAGKAHVCFLMKCRGPGTGHFC